MDDESLDPFLRYLLGGYSSGSLDYTPLFGRTLGDMMPTRALEPPEIPTVSAASMGQGIEPQDPLSELDPRLLMALGLGRY